MDDDAIICQLGEEPKHRLQVGRFLAYIYLVVCGISKMI